MKMRLVTRMMLTLLLLGMLTLAFGIRLIDTEARIVDDKCGVVDQVLTKSIISPSLGQHPSIIVPDDYPTIQEAIDNAGGGDAIFVRNGTYYEHVVVNKRVSVIGEDKKTTIIDGNHEGNVVTITEANVGVTGFTIQNSGIYPQPGYGILGCNFSEGCTRNTGLNISGNIVRNNEFGVSLFSSRNHVSDNTVLSNNMAGILVYFCGNNTISDNTLSENNGSSVGLFGSHHNKMTNNRVSGGTGFGLVQSNENILSENSINNGYFGIYLTSFSFNNTLFNNKQRKMKNFGRKIKKK